MIGSRVRRRVVAAEDDELDDYMPDAKDDEPDVDDPDQLSSDIPSPSNPSSVPSPVPLPKSKSKLSKFPSSSPLTKPVLGAFGQPLDKSERTKKFVETNKERYSWLLDPRDAEGHRPTDENYDPRTLHVPPSAWKSFSAFEKQYWYTPYRAGAYRREVKQHLWDTVLFFQKGKFFELYENDATIGHQEFDLKLTDRTNMRYPLTT
jgi:DNA mismatch repair protein MSH6